MTERRLQRIAEELSDVRDGLELHWVQLRLNPGWILQTASQLAVAVLRPGCASEPQCDPGNKKTRRVRATTPL
jgi:hypothetical protein